MELSQHRHQPVHRHLPPRPLPAHLHQADHAPPPPPHLDRVFPGRHPQPLRHGRSRVRPRPPGLHLRLPRVVQLQYFPVYPGFLSPHGVYLVELRADLHLRQGYLKRVTQPPDR